jgi:hypothetical protein
LREAIKDGHDTPRRDQPRDSFGIVGVVTTDNARCFGVASYSLRFVVRYPVPQAWASLAAMTQQAGAASASKLSARRPGQASCRRLREYRDIARPRHGLAWTGDGALVAVAGRRPACRLRSGRRKDRRDTSAAPIALLPETMDKDIRWQERR